MRKTDILGRYGGEEFIIVLPDISLKNAVFVANKLRKKIEKTTIKLEDQNINLTVSIGVSEWKVNESNIYPTIKRADIALYEAKTKGRNQVCVFEIKV